jgi:SAM-dependent methyltransferase
VEASRVGAARERWQTVAGLEFKVARAESLPFADDTFDGVFMNEVIEHVEDERRSLSEIKRVLRPGGHLVVMAPNRLFPFEGHGMSVGPYRVDYPIPLMPWLPAALMTRFSRARNYWPWQLERLISESGLHTIHRSSVLPVFDIHRWLPGPVDRWYWSNISRLETLPVFNRMGLSTLVIARKPQPERKSPSSGWQSGQGS